MSARSRTSSGADDPPAASGGLSRRTFLSRASLLAAGAPAARRPPGPGRYPADVPAAWFDLALTLVRTTPGFSPPVAARAFAYAGVTLYEAVMPHGLGLQGLARVPRGSAYHWPSVANGALAAILRDLFPTTPEWNLQAIDALERRIVNAAGLSKASRRSAATLGASVARRVFEWSKTDGGHEGFLHNSRPHRAPRGPGLWIPTPPGGYPALQPFWGANRPFTRHRCAARPPLAYSADAGSAFAADAHDCYAAATHLTAEQTAIARFWSDDAGLTATPAGHSISIATQTVRALGVPLDRAAAAYAGVGIAVSDALISCWRTKYRYNVLRPVTYVQRLIDPGWLPLLITPPFPEYTSGHSVQSMAAAHVLTGLFGTIAFTDRTHSSRGGPARSFASFTDAAHEAAMSRLYGGIHFRAAIERGLEQGTCVGGHALALVRG